MKSSNIISGVSFDHSMVTAMISIDVPIRGKSYWKLNCHYLRHDAHFVDFIKSKIVEFKDIHCNSDVNPNILWDTLKRFVTGHCISYTSRKKAEKNKVKSDLHDKIEKVRQEISNFDMDDDSHADLGNLIEQLNSFERDFDKIINQETAGLVVRSRIKWMD